MYLCAYTVYLRTPFQIKLPLTVGVDAVEIVKYPTVHRGYAIWLRVLPNPRRERLATPPPATASFS